MNAALSGPPRPIWKRPWFRYSATVLLLATILLFVPLGEVWETFGRVPLGMWPAAILAYMLLHVMGAAKWRFLVNAAGAGLSMRQAVQFYYAGLFGNTFLPSMVGGDVVRAGLALRETRSKAGLLFGSLVDRTLDILALACVAGIGVLLLPSALDPRSRGIFYGLFATFAILGVATAILLWMLPARRFAFGTRRKLAKVRRAVMAMARRPATVVLGLAVAITLQIGLLLVNVWLGHAGGIDAPLLVWMFVAPLAKIAALLPITQGGLGVREAAQAALFAPFGVPAVLAIAASLLFQAVVISGGLLSGLVSFLLGWKQLASRHAVAMTKDDLVTHP
jgi:uncharacterized membrane protein YbhN (UPF0104 family)